VTGLGDNWDGVDWLPPDTDTSARKEQALEAAKQRMEDMRNAANPLYKFHKGWPLLKTNFNGLDHIYEWVDKFNLFGGRNG
jgi:hypothetical protein